MIFWALIAILYVLSMIPFALKREWPAVLISFGAFLILVGNIWEIVRKS